jgi:two-component system chemotaxis response regulator CheY
VCRFAVGAPKALNYMQSVRALIVDDSSVMRKIVQRCLQQAGVELAEVREANNGTDALDIAAKNQLDLILCDLNMPVMDGIEFVRRLKHIEHARNTPVVMVSSEGGESHVLLALSAGARGYIRKPFTTDQVKEHVVPLLAAAEK